MKLSLNKQDAKQKFLITAWSLYDFANQLFALNIISLYFVRWIIIDKQAPELFYSLAFGLSMFLVACLAPFLGTISDLTHKHRFFLGVFTFLSIIFTMSLGLTQNVYVALLFFAIANFGCQIAVIFYNALLINIAPPGKIGFVSGLGKMFGYCGAAVGLLIIHPLVAKYGRSAAFVPSGMLFLIFSLPCILLIKDRKSNPNLSALSFFKMDNLWLSVKQILNDILKLAKYPVLFNFLKAMFFFFCVVNIIIVFMSVYVTKVFNLAESQFIQLIVFSVFFAIGGSLLSGYVSDRIGYKRTLIGTLILWVICLLFGALANSLVSYFILGPLVAIALGSTWVVSRALAIQIIPAEKIGQMFGLFGFIGYVSAAVGALLWGVILWFLAPLGNLGYRLALVSLVFLLMPSLVYLRRVEVLQKVAK